MLGGDQQIGETLARDGALPAVGDFHGEAQRFRLGHVALRPFGDGVGLRKLRRRNAGGAAQSVGGIAAGRPGNLALVRGLIVPAPVLLDQRRARAVGAQIFEQSRVRIALAAGRGGGIEHVARHGRVGLFKPVCRVVLDAQAAVRKQHVDAVKRLVVAADQLGAVIGGAAV